jgi:hypothetical protein
MKRSIILIMSLIVARAASAQAIQKPQFEAATLKAEAPLQPGESYAANLGVIQNGRVTLKAIAFRAPNRDRSDRALRVVRRELAVDSR